MSGSLQPHKLHDTNFPCPSLSPKVCSNSCPLSWLFIQPSYPLSSPSPLALNLFQNQGLFQCIGSLHQVAKVLEFQFQHQSFQWNMYICGWVPLLFTWNYYNLVNWLYSNTKVGTHVYLWWIHVDIWQNQYNIVKLKNKIKFKNK